MKKKDFLRKKRQKSKLFPIKKINNILSNYSKLQSKSTKSSKNSIKSKLKHSLSIKTNFTENGKDTVHNYNKSKINFLSFITLKSYKNGYKTFHCINDSLLNYNIDKEVSRKLYKMIENDFSSDDEELELGKETNYNFINETLQKINQSNNYLENVLSRKGIIKKSIKNEKK
jgi:hypothetical protein